MQGSHPVYLPRDAVITENVVERMHRETFHGRVELTMAAVRESYRVPRLRSLVKLVRNKCWGCKRFRLNPYVTPVAGQLPEDSTTPGMAFEVVGVHFAGQRC